LWYGEGTYEFSTMSGYPHNTYHGPSRHLRTPLGLDTRPVRFTDSPQHYAMPPPAPVTSPRRKSSSTSNDGSDVSVDLVRMRRCNFSPLRMLLLDI